MPRDLETICLKCLEKEPAKRYADAAELAAEVGRFLTGSRIQARGPFVLSRLAKKVRRHYAATALAASCLLFLLAILAFDSRFDWLHLRPVQTNSQSEQQTEEQVRLAKRLSEAENEKSWMALRGAQSGIDNGNGVKALQMLAAVPPTQRGWDWWYLRRAYDTSMFAMIGHEETITQIIPDGTGLLTP